MAHNLMIENGRAAMMYVGREPWHGLGQRVESAATAEEAIQAANLDWEVLTLPLYASGGSCSGAKWRPADRPWTPPAPKTPPPGAPQPASPPTDEEVAQIRAQRIADRAVEAKKRLGDKLKPRQRPQAGGTSAPLLGDQYDIAPEDHKFSYRYPNKYAVVRGDRWGEADCPFFGIVGGDYRALQNRDAFKFFDPIVGEGAAIYHTAGALGNGERIWILAKLPSDIEVANGDITKKFLLLN